MSLVRALPLFVALGSLLACTRVNPAFDDEAGDEQGSETTRGESDSSESEATSSIDGDATLDADADASESEATSDDPSLDMPPDPICEDSLRQGLDLRFGDPFYFDGGQCPLDGVKLYGHLAIGDGIYLQRCSDALCMACLDEQHPIELGFDIGANIGSCVTVEVQHLIGQNADQCLWGAVSVYGIQGEAKAIATAAGLSPTSGVANFLADYPKLDEVATCKCAGVDIDDACCTDAGGVSFYQYTLPNHTFLPGDPVQVIEFGGVQWRFWAVQAQRVGECNPFSNVETSWAMWTVD
ncbi:hypothetical protein ACNOYE_22600 [Nannocystaceae bacterium ST9]